jgi:hypothetical protein
MQRTDTSKVTRWDQHGREHTVRVRRSGVQRTIRCDTCGWRRGAQFLPWRPAGGPRAAGPPAPGGPAGP